MLLYYAGLSYEKVGSFVHASHEAVREWYQKGRELFEGSMEKKKRKWIAIDEKEIKLNGTTMFILGVVDLDDEKVIGVWISFGRSGLEAMTFLKKIKHACKGKLPRIFIDGGSWYPWALERAGFERYTVISFGPRSAIVRLFAEAVLERFQWNVHKRRHGAVDGSICWIQKLEKRFKRSLKLKVSIKILINLKSTSDANLSDIAGLNILFWYTAKYS
ncbi:MAG: IS6 family transposase [Deltaproteobacteria bacterium]|nr:IS6 family transposase [Deltaproteobacteria bacterium]